MNQLYKAAIAAAIESLKTRDGMPIRELTDADYDRISALMDETHGCSAFVWNKRMLAIKKDAQKRGLSKLDHAHEITLGLIAWRASASFSHLFK